MNRRLPWLSALTILIAGSSIAIYQRNSLKAVQQAETKERFDLLTDRITRQLTQRMQIYEYGLRGARGAVMTAGSEGMTRKKFLAYSVSRELEREFPGSRGYGFIRRVPPDEEASFLKKARTDGWPNFQIRQFTPHPGERLVIQYIEPISNNHEAVGLDIASEENRHQAAADAIHTGNPILTHPITLIQGSGKKQNGFLFLLPVYHQSMPMKTNSERWRASYGLVYTPLVIDDVLADFDLADGEISLTLSDIGSTPEPKRFFSSESADDATEEGLLKRRQIPLYGRQWLIEMKARSNFIASLNHMSPDKMTAEILLATTLLAITAWLPLQNIYRRRKAAFDHSKLAAIVESSTDAIIGKDLNGVVSSWNKAAENIFGYSANDAVGKRMIDLVIPSELAHEEKEILDKIRQGLAVPHRISVRRRSNGELIDVSISVFPIFSENGQVIAASTTVRDITEERRKDRRFKHAIDAAGLGFWVWHLQTGEFSWDERMFELYGAPASLRKSGRYYEFWKTHVHPDDVVQAEAKLQQLLSGEGEYDPTFRIVRDDGEIRWIRASATIEFDHTGKALQMDGTNLDITELVQAKERILELNAGLEMEVAQRTAELQEAIAVVQRATEAKSEFLSNMSHEIRTPMNAVLGMTYLLQKQDLPAESLYLIEKIHGAGNTLLSIINDILDFSKIEAKHLEIEEVPFRLSDVLDNLASIMASAVGDKPVETIIAPPPAGAEFLKGDALRLGQVLINLTSNAIKFTNQGEVMLNISRLDSNDAEIIKLRFSVKDTGIGIPKDKQDAIFKAFSQADTSTTRSYGGTGLGLTISSRLVELMGGTLQVTSELGKGSEFSFEITLGLSDPILNAFPAMAHQRVLIADDQSSARNVLAGTVSSIGWYADAVDSGEAAIKRFSLAASQPYDILLLDWKMPGVDGLQAAQTIRRHWPHKTTPIIVMVTAFDREQLRAQPGNDIIDFVLTKPVTSSNLYNAVQQIKSCRGEFAATLTKPMSTLQLAGTRILIVDDSEINREVAFRILQSEGASIDLAEDGSIAIQILEDHPNDFDVVLMDMQMPVMDGYAATQYLRRSPKLAHIPVIALTAGAFADQRNQALKAGVNAFVAKPFEVDALISTILKLRSPSIEAVPQESGATQPASSITRKVDITAEAPVMNVTRALRVWKNAATYSRFLRKFSESHSNTVSLMMDAEPDEACKLSHKLRGAAAQLGLEQVAALAADVEESLRSGQTEPQLLADLQLALNTVLKAIEDYATNDAIPSPVKAIATGDTNILAPKLARLMQALEMDDMKMVELNLSELADHLPEEHLNPLRSTVADYDLRGAEAILLKLAEHLNIELGK